MPVDVDAEILDNSRLSADYNVVALAAPDIARLTAPGQFVMVKPGTRHDPLLRRPFSVFEILRDRERRPIGVSLLNKRVGIGTRLLYELRRGDRLPCLGPLGRPFRPVAAPAEAWLVAGGVGLGPFVTLAEALASQGTRTTLFYGARTSNDLLRTELFEALGAELALATEDGSRGDRGFVTIPLERALRERGPDVPVHLYVCGPTPMMRVVASLAERFGRRCDVSLEQQMGCGLGGCYSCVVAVRDNGGPPHFVRSCLAGPVFDARTVVWDSV